MQEQNILPQQPPESVGDMINRWHRESDPSNPNRLGSGHFVNEQSGPAWQASEKALEGWRDEGTMPQAESATQESTAQPEAEQDIKSQDQNTEHGEKERPTWATEPTQQLPIVTDAEQASVFPEPLADLDNDEGRVGIFGPGGLRFDRFDQQPEEIDDRLQAAAFESAAYEPISVKEMVRDSVKAIGEHRTRVWGRVTGFFERFGQALGSLTEGIPQLAEVRNARTAISGAVTRGNASADEAFGIVNREVPERIQAARTWLDENVPGVVNKFQAGVTEAYTTARQEVLRRLAAVALGTQAVAAAAAQELARRQTDQP